jgi:hypothetical protein
MTGTGRTRGARAVARVDAETERGKDMVSVGRAVVAGCDASALIAFCGTEGPWGPLGWMEMEG